MPTLNETTVSLPTDQLGYVELLLQSGVYATASEVVRAGLIALRERDDLVEDWLRTEVVPVYDLMMADPGRAIPGSDVSAALDAQHAERLGLAGLGP